MAPINRSSNRARPKGARFSQRQLDRAWVGDLTRKNTRKGSAARSAVNRVEYLRRTGNAEARGISRSQARGHPGRGEQPLSANLVEWSEVPTTSVIVDLITTSKREASRVGRYLHQRGQLMDGGLDPKDFRRYWKTHVRTAGGFELESDPERVLALTFLYGPGPVDRYRRLQPGPAK